MKKFLTLCALALIVFSCAKEAASNLDQQGKSGSITRFAVFNNYMYVLNMNEVQTYDITNKDKPALVHVLKTDYGLETITIYDKTVFLGSTTALYILDITTNPALPVILAKSDRVEAFGFTGCDPVVVKDNYAYSTIKIIVNICGNISAESALLVYDVTNKSNPKAVNQITMNLPNGLGYKENYLFVCDEGDDKLVVFDISKPESIKKMSLDIPINDPVDLIVNGDQMIVSCKTAFQVFDISDVSKIKRIAQIAK
jgi:LVIVD repeat